MSDGRNIYGCLPCPDCESRYRWPTRDVHPEQPSMIVCDDCGRAVEYEKVEDCDNHNFSVYNEIEQ